MSGPITPKETRVWLDEYFNRRPDIGFWKAVLNIVLYPRNPFKPEARRLPRPGFLFSAGLFAVAIVWLMHFNSAQ